MNTWDRQDLKIVIWFLFFIGSIAITVWWPISSAAPTTQKASAETAPYSWKQEQERIRVKRQSELATKKRVKLEHLCVETYDDGDFQYAICPAE